MQVAHWQFDQPATIEKFQENLSVLEAGQVEPSIYIYSVQPLT
jgi:hypothetical protein